MASSSVSMRSLIALFHVPVMIAVPHVDAEPLHVLADGSLDIAIAEESEPIPVPVPTNCQHKSYIRFEAVTHLKS